MKASGKFSILCFIVSLVLALMMTFRVIFHWEATPVFTTGLLAFLGLIFSLDIPKGRTRWLVLFGNLIVLIYVIGFVSMMIYALNHFQ